MIKLTITPQIFKSQGFQQNTLKTNTENELNEVNYLRSLNEPGYALQLAWKHSEVRKLIEISILNGNFKYHPELAKAFISKIDNLCSSGLSDSLIYKELNFFFNKLLENNNLDDSLTLENSERIKYRAKQAEQMLKNTKPTNLLDVGCGDGAITNEVMNTLGLSGDNVIGLEILPRSEAVKSFNIQMYDGKIFPLPDNSQDLITIFSVLHHADNPEDLIKESFRVLKPNASVLVREFDVCTPELQIFNLVMDHMYYFVYLPYPEMPIPGNYLSEKEWTDTFLNAGFILDSSINMEPNNPYKPIMMKFIKPIK